MYMYMYYSQCLRTFVTNKFHLLIFLFGISRSGDLDVDMAARLNTSLASIDPKVESLLMEQEVKRLNESYGGMCCHLVE